ncbi:single-stranded DNA-binding protein [Proteiniclasticum sp. BAD-10]|uniref:Single-stranded DNA-binding protein n=1 Tax=Proteiniclasticum sediminis TaxID=2804028 RepID=A0A941CT32_9CLOT|nr:single-stranded DNA-binding protein [Proteiniclasticum sediminis]MBR0576783.1 single-stranded DNA-binding protein [Proteiniclasticum sediminis]
MNKVVLIGRLTKDPELKYTPGNGTAVTTVTLAVDRRFNQEGKKEADFIPVVIWGKSAESTAQYMTKGLMMAVFGRIQTRSYEAKEGGKRYVTEVVAEEIKFLEWGKKNDSAGHVAGGDYEDMMPIEDGDIPF